MCWLFPEKVERILIFSGYCERSLMPLKKEANALFRLESEVSLKTVSSSLRY